MESRQDQGKFKTVNAQYLLWQTLSSLQEVPQTVTNSGAGQN